MSKSHLLSPVVCNDEAEIGEAAFDGVRRRPVVAINDDGKLVVCCRRTASKNGWALKGSLHQRPRPEASSVKTKQARRATDNEHTVVITKTRLAKVKEAFDSQLGDLLDLPAAK